MDSGEWRPLRLKDDLPAVVKSDLEASGKVTANKGFIAKYANDGSTYPRVSKFCNFYPADKPQFGQQSPIHGVFCYYSESTPGCPNTKY